MRTLLTAAQKKRLTILESHLDIAINLNDFKAAQKLIQDIQEILKPAKQFDRFAQCCNKLYELAISLNNVDVALKALRSCRRTLRPHTKTYLQTTSLLAIGHLRKQEIAKAKPYIKEALTNKTAITLASERRTWQRQMIKKIKEEVTLSNLKSKRKPAYDKVSVQKEVERLMEYDSMELIYEEIGEATPGNIRKMLSMLDKYASTITTNKIRSALPGQTKKAQNAAVGVTVLASVKKVLYNSLCSPESDIYKAWFNNGIKVVLSKAFISTAVTSCLISYGIGMPLLIASVIALITKFGIEVYCERFKSFS